MSCNGTVYSLERPVFMFINKNPRALNENTSCKLSMLSFSLMWVCCLFTVSVCGGLLVTGAQLLLVLVVSMSGQPNVTQPVCVCETRGGAVFPQMLQFLALKHFCHICLCLC